MDIAFIYHCDFKSFLLIRLELNWSAKRTVRRCTFIFAILISAYHDKRRRKRMGVKLMEI